MAYKARLNRPEAGNKYYIRKANGGYSPCIAGKCSTTGRADPTCDVLPNCVGYALGRFNEIGGYGCIKYLGSANAELFYGNAIKAGLKVGQTPKLGAIMCWQKGATLSGGDGAGHVAVVEQVYSDTDVLTSESGYNCKNAFWTQRRAKGSNARWGEGAGYTFLGFIYNPAVSETATATTEKKATETARNFDKAVAGTYIVTATALNMRNGAGTAANEYGKNKSVLVSLPKGTKVTCYGYYTAVSGTKWLYAVAGAYTGFVSAAYLAR